MENIRCMQTSKRVGYRDRKRMGKTGVKFIDRKVPIKDLFFMGLGYFLGLFLLGDTVKMAMTALSSECRNTATQLVQKRANYDEFFSRRPDLDRTVVVGLMSSRQTIATRAAAISQTWGNNFPGLIVLYVGQDDDQWEKTKASRDSGYSRKKLRFKDTPSAPILQWINDIPVVELDVKDKDYPPRDKCYAMITHMTHHFYHRFHWFIRADDDVYIHGDKMVRFLHSIDNDKRWYIGNWGLGVPAEQGKLGLDKGKTFCMGGPGVIFSPSSLKGLKPNLEDCAATNYTYHEDTELGRCVMKSLNLSCTSSWLMRKLMYQDFAKNKFHGQVDTKITVPALSIHPLKDPRIMHKVHVHYQLLQVQALQERQRRLREEIALAENRGKRVLAPKPAKIWHTSLDRKKSVEDYLERMKQELAHRPRAPAANARHLLSPMSELSDSDIQTLRQEILVLDNPEWTYAYVGKQPKEYEAGNAHPSHKLLLNNHSEHWQAHRKKLKSPVAKVWQLHGKYQSLSLVHGLQHLIAIPYDKGHLSFMLTSKFQDLHFHELQSFQGTLRGRSDKEREKKEADLAEFSAIHGVNVSEAFPHSQAGSQFWPELHFVSALAGRLQTYLRFLAHLSFAALRYPAKVHLRVAVFEDPNKEYKRILQASRTNKALDITVIDMGNVSFSRAVGLGKAAEGITDPDTILVFMDVDLVLADHFLERVATNTRPGQAYFPIMFNKYSPKFVCYGLPQCTLEVYDFSADAGMWRWFSYGMGAVTAGDLKKAGGFNTSFVGWGKEDVDFYERVVSQGISTFRNPDVGLIHEFHDKHCDPSLEPEQFVMCEGSKLSIYASLGTFVRIVGDFEHDL